MDGTTVAFPFWTGMMLFSIDRREPRRRQHNLLEEVYAHHGRDCFKGQLFSAPMDWSAVVQQFQDLESKGSLAALPVVGAVLSARVLLVIAPGFVDVNKVLK